MDKNLMKMVKPEISIILPVYNASKYLAEAIKSVVEQTFKNFELIIINDGSTDDSQTIIDQFTDERIRVFQKPNTGLIDTLNLGISYSRANWIARMDSDDLSCPNRLEEQFKYIDENIAVIGSQAYLIDANGKVYGKTNFPTDHKKIVSRLLNNSSCIIHPSVLINKLLINKVGGYDPKMNVAEDYDLWLRISKIGKIININEPLLFFRKHENSFSMTKLGISVDNSLVSISYSLKLNSPKIISINDYNFLLEKVSRLTKSIKLRSLQWEIQKGELKLLSSVSKFGYLILHPKTITNYFIIRIKKKWILNRLKK